MAGNDELVNVISENIERVRQKINDACLKVGRSPKEVTLVAVTKTVGVSKILAAISAGHSVFGENYIQEARGKISEIAEPAQWHFIGHLQRNKAKYAVRLFDVIETIDTVRLAAELQKRAETVNKVQQVLVQVNVSGEEQKSGISPENVDHVLRFLSRSTSLEVRGFMTIPPFLEKPEDVRPYFVKLRELRDQMSERFPALNLKELSMGMSSDFEVAIEEGATIVRVGTAIFGKRPQ